MTLSVRWFICGLPSLHLSILLVAYWFSGSYITVHLIIWIKHHGHLYIPMGFCSLPLCFFHSQPPSWQNTLILIMPCRQLYSMAWQVSLIHLHGFYLSALFKNQSDY